MSAQPRESPDRTGAARAVPVGGLAWRLVAVHVVHDAFSSMLPALFGDAPAARPAGANSA